MQLQVSNLQSRSTPYMAVDKLHDIFEQKLCFYVNDKKEDWRDLIMLEKLLSRVTFKHEAFSAFKRSKKDEDQRSPNRGRLFCKTSNFIASSTAKETKLHSTSLSKLCAFFR